MPHAPASDPLDPVFRALADGTRRRILDVVKRAPGCNVNQVCAAFDMTRIGVMKHLRILEEADLIRSGKDGRNRRLYLNAVPLRMILDRWTTEYSALWAEGLTRLKYDLENDHGKRT